MCPATYWFFTLYDKHELSDLAKRIAAASGALCDDFAVLPHVERVPYIRAARRAASSAHASCRVDYFHVIASSFHRPESLGVISRLRT